MDLLEIFKPLNPYLGWSSLVFYVLVVVFTQMKTMRIAAYGSIINDIFYGLSMGINGLAKVTINLAVACINTNRYARDFTHINKTAIHIITALAVLGVLGIAAYGIYSLYTDFSWAGVLLWSDAAITISALTVKNIRAYKWLMLLACFPAIPGYYMIGEWPMVIIKSIVGSISAYHLYYHMEEPAEKAEVTN